MKYEKLKQFTSTIKLEPWPGATIDWCIEEAIELLQGQFKFNTVEFQFNDRLIKIEKNKTTVKQALKQYYGNSDEN